ncbi:UbiA family prenyltransferase [bacterium]|nr:UbiA family prenyltransferase [bacterium]
MPETAGTKQGPRSRGVGDTGPAPPPARPLPLAVDLDGTLLKTDTLIEAFLDNLRTRPLRTLASLGLLIHGRPRFKAATTEGSEVDVDLLPENPDIMAHIERARAEGRPVWLVSAADQGIVDRVAARFGCFDRAIGSDGERNNKGARKGELLKAAFPDGFEYVGDSLADYGVWSRASAAAHVGGGEGRARGIAAMNVTVTGSYPSPLGGALTWLRAMRPHQWAKNALLFVAPILGMQMFDADAMLRTALGFLCMCALASGTYFLNDLLDLASDRAHPTKRHRPFAAGRLDLAHGLSAAIAMMAGAMVGAVFLSPAFALEMAIYLAATLSYSFALKRAPLLDAMILAGLYTLRLYMGGVLSGVAITEWLLAFSMFLFFSLSVAKRHVEVVRAARAGKDKLKHRGYRAEDAPLTLGLGLASAAATPLILALYIMDSAQTSGLYARPDALWGAPVIITLWLSRVWLLANRGELDDDPVAFAVKDRLSLALGGLLFAVFGVAAFLPA